MHYADTYRDTTAHRLVGAAAQNVHTIPQALQDDYDQLLQLVDEGTTRPGKWRHPKLERDAEQVARQLIRLSNYGGTDGIIRDHIQPALADYIDGFTADLETAGAHGRQAAVSAPMLLEPQDVREALVRIHEAPIKYGMLRTSWSFLRGRPQPNAITNTNVDPRASDSPLGECRNIADLIPEWESAGRAGGTSRPWGNASSAHIRLAWLLDHGGIIWAPTAAEHDALYRNLRDASLAARRGPGPRRALTSSGHSAA
ncbi:hypothetical protein [Streptomyces sp. NPDC048577]|uniref:hypothetical protein n=1 Tax=Streptomyces sp. NPDC048577 TaxID=3157209 RepID=UPI003439EF75